MSEPGVPVPIRQSRRPIHPVWGISLRDLRRSLYAEQVMSALVDELQAKEYGANVLSPLVVTQLETSRLRIVAVGHCIRLHFIPTEASTEQERTRQLLMETIRRTDLADVRAQDELTVLVQSGVEADWLHSLQLWHRERRRWLHSAFAALERANG
ncbi:hypothetical protein C7445_10567 [Alicyclobacillus sacchari]|uniref:Uncharacterized protein n=1 Tax=Alicyclobacillus sacchari TaxID=392010 RepID=A0A4V3HEH6_9BACL|nr:hypothetical protein [Alicyclobacillus sacchari]TDY47889.1 hypothetical protein C7445_10567 [Alicyclobacillus sacchari]GMA55985.1 hypothetical protein GCM10025858_04880 [Alicyclobacillus sacchari]